MDTGNGDGIPHGQRCPICGRPTEHKVRPFCSGRCKEIDLGRWLTGAYVIEGGRTDEDGEADDAVGVDASTGAGRDGAGAENET